MTVIGFDASIRVGLVVATSSIFAGIAIGSAFGFVDTIINADFNITDFNIKTATSAVAAIAGACIGSITGAIFGNELSRTIGTNKIGGGCMMFSLGAAVGAVNVGTAIAIATEILLIEE